ncbi:hypothetical protein EV421DRAFT_1907013 [Armillaria borealis]|uniref:Protein CPL1-like domain-containing protein n=1 Tax=Armillaria borealis TaxID=47425 RepID=A0AA39MLG9_9AGAR|nr:hypothetical protein EV421DRAFT_1907013 [Armillaria borealis]
MRFTLTLVVSSLLTAFFSTAFAASPSLVKSHKTPRTLAQRQYHHQPRDLLDICISLDVDALLKGGILSLLPLDVFAGLDLCLCLKDLDIFLSTNVVVDLLDPATKSLLETRLKALINTGGEHCDVLPTHSHRVCNNRNPCHWECDSPYIQRGDQCVCPPPKSECNGQCGVFPRGCGSAVPRSHKRRQAPVTTLTEAQATCKTGQSVCGVPSSKGKYDYECMDTSSALDSCGGCTVPHPFGSAQPSHGANCNTIPYLVTGSCRAGRCVVDKCHMGYQPSKDQASCVTVGPERRTTSIVDLRPVGVDSTIALDLGKGVDDLLNNLAASLGIASLIYPSTTATPYSTDEILANVNLLVRLNLRLNSQLQPLATSTLSTLSDAVPQLLNLAAKLNTKITVDLGSDLGQITDLSDLVNRVLALLGTTLAPGGLTDNTVQELTDIQTTVLALNAVLGRMTVQLNACGCHTSTSLLDDTNSLIASILRKRDTPLVQGGVFARRVFSRRGPNSFMSSANVNNVAPAFTTRDIRVDACELLKSLGLDRLVSINVDVEGLAGLEQLTNGLLKLLELGGYPIACGPSALPNKPGASPSSTSTSPSSSAASTSASPYPSIVGVVDAAIKSLVGVDGVIKILVKGCDCHPHADSSTQSVTLATILDTTAQLIDASLDVGDDLQVYVNGLASLTQKLVIELHAYLASNGLTADTVRIADGLVNACDLLVDILQDAALSLGSCGCKTDQGLVTKVKASVASSTDAQALSGSNSTPSSGNDGIKIGADIKLDLRGLLGLGGGGSGRPSNGASDPTAISVADGSTTVPDLLALVNNLLDGVINLNSLLGQSSSDLSTNGALQDTLGTINRALSTLNLGSYANSLLDLSDTLNDVLSLLGVSPEAYPASQSVRGLLALVNQLVVGLDRCGCKDDEQLQSGVQSGVSQKLAQLLNINL